MSGLNELTRDIGLNPIRLENGMVLDTTSLVEALFVEIQRRCANGEEIRIKGFGTFKGRVINGRTLNTPVVPGGECVYPDRLLLKFQQSQKSKTKMNEDADAAKKFKAAVEARKNGATTIVTSKDGEPKKEAKKTGSKKSKKDGVKKDGVKKDGDKSSKKKTGSKKSKKSE
jgi:nucleoid DNA-binding protein